MSTEAELRPAAARDLPQVLQFLDHNDLPTIGVKECLDGFIIAQDGNGSWIGVAGLERYGRSGLLRSVAVDQQFRGQGHGQKIVESVLNNARAKGVDTVYLLTESAEAYFKRLGFEVVDRADIENAVKASPEFSECCETAAAMRKRLQ